MTKEEKERLQKLTAEHMEEKDEDPGIDYAEEYKKQTGKDFITGEIVTQ